MARITKKEKSDGLYQAILTLRTEEEVYDFFQDLCTVTELRAMEQRFKVAVLLKQGMIYNDILERTGASSATISRVNRSLAFGHGGYQTFFERQAERKERGEEEP
ncbi:MAG: TrpR-like protein [Oscillospiraceae bacterium]|nr:TrpR-like protein [Oscillospiraceae bacterium]MDE6931919.1 TrpR-like protein [Oscillospiraceae bacterium]MDE7042332.1 TrpR-like protein [Oscillospiraceae bacterium]